MTSPLKVRSAEELIECSSCHAIQAVLVKTSRHGSGGNMLLGVFTCTYCGQEFESYVTNDVVLGPLAI